MTAETYPTDNSGNTASLSYTFDSMGRLNTMTDNIAGQPLIQGATYGPANELLSITGNTYNGAYLGETRTYNSLKQLTGITSGTWQQPLSISYTYPSTGNNGKIASQTDLVSGETVTYSYDALNRLATAATQSNISVPWGQSFTYDGFGNLTNVGVTQGSTPTLTASYDGNNHAGGEDANGNPSSIPAPAYGANIAATYDVENRLVSGGAFYSYAPGNKRVWRGTGTWNSDTGQWSPTDEVTFWSVNGQKLATYQLTTSLGIGPPSPSQPAFYATQTATNYYFGSKLIKNVNGWVYSDRLGSIGKFYPYGIERPSATTNGTEKFTGYFRDSETGNDYAVNRYLSPGMGRFITPDRGMGGASATAPGSWNKYAYVKGDPINFRDPHGRVAIGPGWQPDVGDDDDDGGGGGWIGGGGGGGSGCFGGPNGLIERPSPECPPIAGPPQNPPLPSAPAPHPPTCEQQEIEYVYQYLNSYGSPLATMAIATQIVSASDAAGVDDRFIVALAGIESQYGKTALASPTWGQYNAFSNSQHCKALSATSLCVAVNPYTSYAQAINGVIGLITTGAYQSLTSGASVYNLYETGNPTTNAPALPSLATIYEGMRGNMQDVKFSRCR